MRLFAKISFKLNKQLYTYRMTNSAKFHFFISDPQIETELQQAFSLKGFLSQPQTAHQPIDLDVLSDSDLLVLDRKSFISLLKAPVTSAVHAGPLILYPESFEAICDGRVLPLTTSEFQLLLVLCKNRPQVLSRKRLVQIFAKMGFDLSLRTVDNHIFNLRKKLAAHQDIIGTIRGIGYKVSAI